MDNHDRKALGLVRGISNAGLMECRRAISEAEGDICQALRFLMSDEEIKVAIAARRVQEMDPVQSEAVSAAKQEGEILARLEAMLRVEKREERESDVASNTTFDLPEGFSSFEDLVQFFRRTMETTPDHNSFVAACRRRGIAGQQIGYLLDRIEGGAYRAAMAQSGAPDTEPDLDSDPIAHAVYRDQFCPRRWWQFWRRK